jgi:hypothetical protein
MIDSFSLPGSQPGVPEDTEIVNFKALTWAVFALLVTACAGPQLKKEIIRDPPSYAIPAAQSGPLAEMSKAIQAESGADHSGFILLDGSADGLNWRLALIDSAVSSLDIQTYLWYPDLSLVSRQQRSPDPGARDSCVGTGRPCSPAGG